MSSASQKSVIIIGGGLAGLASAVKLHEAGVDALILEASDHTGGRVRTDEVDGFLLDRGFQVYLDAYPEAGKLLDLPKLDLRKFKSGAILFQNKRLHRVMDVFREPCHLIRSALAPVGSMLDKLRVARLKWRVSRSSMGEITSRGDKTTLGYLQADGFSRAMIDVFFRSFYGGIFLERDLRTSCRMFEFTFKLFSKGSATLPALGMREIPRQLSARLPAACIRCDSPVAAVQPGIVTLQSGEQLTCDTVVIATDATTAACLLPGLEHTEPAWRSVTCLYYAANRSPLDEAIIALNGSGHGLVNHVCVPSDVTPYYAPRGKSLISVTILGLPEITGLELKVQDELKAWFGNQVSAWRHLSTQQIPRALPEQAPGTGFTGPGFRDHGGILVCGDHLWSASIEGAIISGSRTAESILQTL
jgi:phytoene dehydrogenase-like protein